MRRRRQLHLQHEPGLWPPSWPMGLTLLRLFLLPVFLMVLLSGTNEPGDRHRAWAVGIFAIMAVTDKLDGYLARKLNQTSKIGALLDPLADKLLIISSVIVLSFGAAAPDGFRIPRPLVAIIYGKDLLVAVGVMLLLSHAGKVPITARPLGKFATFLQLMLVIVTLLAPDLARLNEQVTHLAMRTIWWITGAVTLASTVDYLLVGIRQLVGVTRPSAR